MIQNINLRWLIWSKISTYGGWNDPQYQPTVVDIIQNINPRCRYDQKYQPTVVDMIQNINQLWLILSKISTYCGWYDPKYQPTVVGMIQNINLRWLILSKISTYGGWYDPKFQPTVAGMIQNINLLWLIWSKMRNYLLSYHSHLLRHIQFFIYYFIIRKKYLNEVKSSAFLSVGTWIMYKEADQMLRNFNKKN